MQKLNKILPQSVVESIQNINFHNLQEIRLRADKPVSVLYGGKRYFLSKQGITLDISKTFFVSSNEVQNTLLNACQHSIYSFSSQLAKGFVAPFSGVRIGICGTAVYDAGEIVSFKEISSLNVRLPHEVKNCSKYASKYLLKPIQNVLVVSCPGAGKTTFLRDLVFQTSQLDNSPCVLIADERGEIAGCIDGKIQFDLGNFCDVVSMANKIFAFESGIRTMSPQIMVCDEICNDDLQHLQKIAQSGVNLFCSMHGKNVENILENKDHELLEKIFDRFVFLSNENYIGEIIGIFDKHLNRLDI